VYIHLSNSWEDIYEPTQGQALSGEDYHAIALQLHVHDQETV